MRYTDNDDSKVKRGSPLPVGTCLCRRSRCNFYQRVRTRQWAGARGYETDEKYKKASGEVRAGSDQFDGRLGRGH